MLHLFIIHQFHATIFSFILTEVYSIITAACCFFETSGRQQVLTDGKNVLSFTSLQEKLSSR